MNYALIPRQLNNNKNNNIFYQQKMVKCNERMQSSMKWDEHNYDVVG